MYLLREILAGSYADNNLVTADSVSMLMDQEKYLKDGDISRIDHG